MQSMVPQYLEASMEAFKRNQAQFRNAMQGAFAGGPFAELAKRNMEMFEAATGAFQKAATRPASAAMGAAAEGAGNAADELAQLKSQLAGLQEKLDKLAK